MEATSSCSSPLSVQSRIDFVPPSFSRPRHRRVSAKFDRNRPFPLAKTTTSGTGCCIINSSSSSSSSSYFGISISPKRSFNSLSLPSSRKRYLPTISAVFERFTERAIKAVMFSQREAKALGKDMVFTQHLLLGLIAESRAPDGFLGSGITIDVARDAVRSIWHNDESNDQNSVASEIRRFYTKLVLYRAHSNQPRDLN